MELVCSHNTAGNVIYACGLQSISNRFRFRSFRTGCTRSTPVGTPPSQTLQYIADTDQGDRSTLTEDDIRKLLQQRNPRVDSIDYRDSLRYSALWELHSRGLIKTPTDMYNAGVVFTHSGGSRIKDDTLSYNLAKQYLEEAIEEGDSVISSKALYFLDFVEFRLKPMEPGLHLEIQ